jgi:hypothetical protein
MRFGTAITIALVVILLLSLASWFAPVTRYGALLAGGFIGGAWAASHQGRPWKWLLGAGAGLAAGTILSLAVWIILVPAGDYFPWPNEANFVIISSTLLPLASWVDSQWIVDQTGDHFPYLTFGITNMLLAMVAGLVASFLVTGRPSQPSVSGPGRIALVLQRLRLPMPNLPSRRTREPETSPPSSEQAS